MTKPEGAATSIPRCSVQISFILRVLIHHMLPPVTLLLYIDTPHLPHSVYFVVIAAYCV